jgi:hypothetical protein
MKIRIISLPQREDRRKAFVENNGKFLEGHDWEFMPGVEGHKLTYPQIKDIGFDTCKTWRDPILNRTLTRGEVGCFLSHWKLWEYCDEVKEPVLILEDDTILLGSPEDSDIKSDITYLTYKEMLPEGSTKTHVCYPYWCAAYIVTPHAASVLLSTDVDQNIIPVDEYIPRMTDKLEMTHIQKATQRQRTECGTETEPKSDYDYLIDFNVHVLTCGDDESRMSRLTTSCPEAINILSRDWVGGTMQGPGGGQKLNELRKYIKDKKLPDHDVVLFTDAFDVFYVSSIAEILSRYLGMKSEVVFAAEMHKWPDDSLRWPPTVTKYRYLNSGCFIGRVGEIRRMLDRDIPDSADDQLFLQKQYLTGGFKAKLDEEQYIFMTHDPLVGVRKEKPYNPETKCFGSIYHGNGGQDAKQHFEALYDKVFPSIKYAQFGTSDYKEIGPEMLLVDFLTPSQCEEWIRLGEENKSWNPHPHDKFPSHDIHLNKLGLMEECDHWWRTVAAPVFEKYWKPTRHYHLRKAFLMKYSMDTQKTLGLHNDAALVTGSVKLNDDYEGATLIFPRQGITNKDIPIGKMILFPSQLTHGHHVDQLTSGVKYSATFWTARYKDDLLND